MEYSLVERINYLSFNLVKDSIPDILYHYSTADVFIKTIESKEYYISHYQNFPDKDEILFGINVIYKIIKMYSYFPGIDLDLLIENLKADVIKGINLYCLSFTNDSNSEFHWNNYADNHTGVVFGIRNHILAKILRNFTFTFSFILPVNYFSETLDTNDPYINSIRCLDFFNTLKECIFLIHEEFISIQEKEEVIVFF